MHFSFHTLKETKDNLWESLLMKSECNLNYEAYFVKYQTISYPLNSLSGLVFNDSIPVAMFVVYSDVQQTRILPMSLPPIYFSDNPIIRSLANDFYQNLISCQNQFQELVLNNKRNVSWLPQLHLDSSELTSKAASSEFIIELEKSEETLLDRMSRNHKRTIKNAIETGQRVIEISSCTAEKEINFYFNIYREMHTLVSGRETRPIESFEFMKELIYRGICKLFINFLEEEPISFLYCDSAREYARGWSQVTKPNLGKKIFPRTLLEWTAMKSYKKEGRKVYYLGALEKKPTNSISELYGFEEFKRRFGPTEI